MLAQLLSPLRARRAAPVAELRVEGVGALPVVVEGTAEGARALRLAPEPPIASRFLHRRPASLVLEGQAPEAGVLLAVPGRDGGVDPERLQFLPEALRSQRRDYVRVPATVPLSVLGTPFGALEGDLWTVDVSAGGVLVGGLDAGGPGDRMRLRLALPAEIAGERPAPLTAGAAIVRVTAEGLRAVRLDLLDTVGRDRIVAYVAARQRGLLQARRERERYR